MELLLHWFLHSCGSSLGGSLKYQRATGCSCAGGYSLALRTWSLRVTLFSLLISTRKRLPFTLQKFGKSTAREILGMQHVILLLFQLKESQLF
nr:hypothetical protein Iba_chr08dCG9930 [Ipomoea batatas]